MYEQTLKVSQIFNCVTPDRVLFASLAHQLHPTIFFLLLLYEFLCNFFSIFRNGPWAYYIQNVLVELFGYQILILKILLMKYTIMVYSTLI